MKRYNVYKRRNGRWEGRLPFGKNKDGKRKYKYFFGKSREEVIEKMNSIKQTKAAKDHCAISVKERNGNNAKKRKLQVVALYQR